MPVLANDGDPAGSLSPNTLQIQVGQPTHGTATVNANGTITYTSGSTYSGEDEFSYKVCAPDPPEQRGRSAILRITSAPVTGP